MNLALWLARAAKSHPSAPAVAIGTHVARNYSELAERAARLGGALHNQFGLRFGDRVAIVAHNCVEYVELLYGIWHAGLAAVPVNAKLHGANPANSKPRCHKMFETLLRWTSASPLI